MRTLAIPSLLFLGLTACSGGDGGTPLGGDVVGMWRQLPNATDDTPDPVEERQVITFEADGTWSVDGGEELDIGNYTIDGGEITFTEPDLPGFSTVPYLATSDRLVLSALVSVGSHDGLVGTWTGTAHSDKGDRTATFDLAADATAHVEFESTDEPLEMHDGTWRSVGNDAAITVMVEENFTVTTRATLVSEVLGTPFERL